MSYILLHNNIKQNRLFRWENPPNFAPAKYSVLTLSSLIKKTKKNGAGYYSIIREIEKQWVMNNTNEIRYNSFGSFGTWPEGCTGNETT